MTAENHRAIVFQTVAGEPQRAESPGQAPALRIPRWDRDMTMMQGIQAVRWVGLIGKLEDVPNE